MTNSATPPPIAPGLRTIYETNPSAEIRNELGRNIDAYNARSVPFEHLRFAFLLRSDGDALKGGLIGMLYWDWLFIDALWIEDGLRGRGFGTQLVKLAERRAVEGSCHSAWLDTFQALGFYRKLNYEVFGTLDDYPVGQQRFFLKKRLSSTEI